MDGKVLKEAAATATAKSKLPNGSYLGVTVSVDNIAIGNVTVSEVEDAIKEALDEIRRKTEQWQSLN